MGETLSRTGRCLSEAGFRPALTGAASLLLDGKPVTATAGAVGIVAKLAVWKFTTSDIYKTGARPTP